MDTYVVRVWLPDRPGALGAVASRVGAVRGDVIGIEILETGGGQAVDELVVRLPQAQLVELLVTEVEQVDGVRVEEVRPIPDGDHDPALRALEEAAGMVSGSGQDALDVLCDHAAERLGSAWVAVFDPSAPATDPVAVRGPVPTSGWLTAYVAGHRAAADPAVDDDVTTVDLSACGLSLVAGRPGRPFRSRERRQLAALARVAGARCQEAVPS